jgi:hypothetical protein
LGNRYLQVNLILCQEAGICEEISYFVGKQVFASEYRTLLGSRYLQVNIVLCWEAGICK